MHVDLAGPFKTPSFDELGARSKRKSDLKTWVVLMIDYFTKVAEFAVVYSKEPAQIANVFYSNWVCRYAVPANATTDNGLSLLRTFRTGWCVWESTTSPHHHHCEAPVCQWRCRKAGEIFQANSHKACE